MAKKSSKRVQVKAHTRTYPGKRKGRKAKGPYRKASRSQGKLFG